MEKKNQNTNKKIIQISSKQVHQVRDTRTKNVSKKHRKKRMLGRQSIFAGGFCIVAALAIVIGIFVSNKTKTPYEKQVITLYEKENESLAEQQTNPEAGMDEGISSGLKQVRDYGVKLPESFQNPPIFESTFTSTGDTVLDTANRYAAMYDYDKAIETIKAVSGYESNAEYTKALEEYDLEKSRLFQWNDNYTITHIFFHTLIVDPEKTFDVSLSSKAQVIAYNEAMTTIDEFVKIIQKMYDDGYVLVGLHDVAEMVTQPDGTQIMQMKPIYLPAGKTPFVLSQDDVCYYEYMDGDGFASRMIIGEDGKPTNEMKMDDGSVSVGSYDLVPLLDDFIKEHPDFSYRGAKACIAFTGYNGILGYRTDSAYNTDEYKAEHPDFNFEEERANAAKVVQCLRDDGFEIASHSWGHRNMGTIPMDKFREDTDKWANEVETLTGPCDIILFPFGSDIGDWHPYDTSSERFQYLYNKGFRYFCNVDSSQYFVQVRDNYLRMGRRNLDGYRLYQNLYGGGEDRTSDLFDSASVIDPQRPTDPSLYNLG